MALILRMIGPKCLDAMPILMVLIMAKVKATPHRIRPAELNTFGFCKNGITENPTVSKPFYKYLKTIFLSVSQNHSSVCVLKPSSLKIILSVSKIHPVSISKSSCQFLKSILSVSQKHPVSISKPSFLLQE